MTNFPRCWFHFTSAGTPRAFKAPSSSPAKRWNFPARPRSGPMDAPPGGANFAPCSRNLGVLIASPLFYHLGRLPVNKYYGFNALHFNTVTVSPQPLLSVYPFNISYAITQAQEPIPQTAEVFLSASPTTMKRFPSFAGLPATTFLSNLPRNRQQLR